MVKSTKADYMGRGLRRSFSLIFLLITAVSTYAQNDCASAITISSLPFASPSGGYTTCGANNDYNPYSICGNAGTDGQDAVFKFTPTGANSCVTFLLEGKNPPLNAAGSMFIFDRCPGSLGVQCVASVVNSGATNISLTNQKLEPGVTYYIVVDGGNSGSPFCHQFKLSASAGTCAALTPTGAVGTDCNNPINISFPYSAANASTAGMGIDFTGGCKDANNAGEDVYYHFTTAVQRCIKYQVSGITSGSTVYLISGCPGSAGATCVKTDICRDPICTGLINEATIPAGDYYIVVKSDSPYKSANYSIKIESLTPDDNIACLTCNDSDNCAPCKNAGFEKMSLQNWSGNYGTYTTPNATAGFITGNPNDGMTRHTLVSRGHYDTLINVLEVVPPNGGDYAVRLGNCNNGKQAEQITYSVLIDSNNTNFIYQYAVVFEDPAHTDAEQPYFSIGMNVGGQNISCAQYEVRPKPGLEGFKDGGKSPGNPGTAPGSVAQATASPMYYKEWTTVNIPLLDYIGQVASITFTTKDCSLGGHFGYAYLDAKCERLAIMPDNNLTYCKKDTITMMAPSGFSNYVWNTGERTQTIRVTKKGTYTVTCTTVTGCVISLSKEIKMDSPALTKFDWSYDCVAQNFHFTDKSELQDGTPIAKWEWSFGDGDSSFIQNPVHKYTTSGNYSVTLRVYTPTGCTMDTTIIVPVFVAPHLTVDISGTTTICAGASNTLTAVPNGGVPPYSYLWNTGATTSSIVGGAGTYMLRITDATGYGCFYEDTITVSQMPPVSVNIAADTIFACSSTDFRSVVAVGSSTVKSYLWSNGDGGNTVLLLPGKYYVTVYDSLGCTAKDSVVVAQPATLLGGTITEPQPVCYGTQGLISAQGTGGYGGYTYVWNTGDAGKFLTKPVGTYCAIITDGKGCKATVCGDIKEMAELQADVTGATSICSNATTNITASATGGKTAYSYSWNTGQTGATINVGPGTYIVTVTDGSIYGCKDKDTLVIGSPTPISVNILPDSIFACSATELRTVTANGTGPIKSYLWSNGDGTSSVQLAAGKYWVTVSDTLSCTATDSVVVAKPTTVISASVEEPQPVCNGTLGELIAKPVGGYSSYTYFWGIGETTKNVFKTKGNYCVTVTDLHGCSASACGLVRELDSLKVDITGKQLICADSTTKLSVSLSGGQPSYSYKWSNSATDPSIIVGAGTYILTVTDGSIYGCEQSDTIIIKATPKVTVSIVPDTIFNCKSTDLARITAFGSPTVISYTWSNGDATSVTQVPDGKYSVIAKDSLGCTGKDSVVVIVPATVLSGQVIDPQPICNGTTGSISAQGVGGYGNYTYLWSTGETTKKIDQPAGNYCVTITDNNACKVSVCGTVVELSKLQTAIDGKKLICAGAKTPVTSITSGGQAPYTYLWSNTATTPNVNVGAGTYILTVTDASANACQDKDTIVIKQTAPLTVDIPTDTLWGCASTSLVTVTAQGGIGNYTYTWSNGDAGPTVILGVGTHYVVVTDSLGCTASDTVRIVSPSSTLNGSVTSGTPVCFGDTGYVIAQGVGGYGNYTYLWNTTETTKKIDHLAGNYCVTITDEYKCKVTACGTITELPLLKTNISGAELICSGAKTNINTTTTGGQAPYTYLWNTGANTPSVNVGGGTYMVMVTDASGNACQDKDTIIIKEAEQLVVEIPRDTVYGCDPTSLVTVTARGGAGKYTYQWSNGDGGATATLGPGKWWVTITDSLGCKGSDTVWVILPAKFLTAQIDSVPTVCHGTAGVLVAQGNDGYGAYKYSWDSGENTKSVSKTTGVYCVTVSDQKGCKAKVCGSVAEYPELQVSIAGDSTICRGTLTSISATVSGGNAPYTYLWNTGATTSTLTDVGVGLYSVVVTGSGKEQCTGKEAINIKELPKLNMSMSFTNITCNGGNDGKLQAAASGGVPPYAYLWKPLETTTPTVNNLPAGSYVLETTDAEGCKRNDSVKLTEPTAIQANIISTVDVTCPGSADGSLQAQVSGGTPDYSFSWSPSGGNTETATGLSGGVYTLHITDDKNCRKIISGIIREPQPISINAQVVPVTCYQGADGNIQLQIQGGTPPYIKLWTPAVSGGEVAANLKAGSYSVAVSDANKCKAIKNLNISEPAQLILATSVNNDYCDLQLGKGFVNVVSGGNAPFTYLWDANADNQTTNPAVGLGQGYYQVVVTDKKGCTANSSITVSNSAGFTAAVTGLTPVLCYGESSGSLQVSLSGGGSGSYTYEWFDKTTGASVGQFGPIATGLRAGIYYVKVKDIQGCEAISEDYILQNPAPFQANIQKENVKCFEACDGRATANATGGIEPYSYRWNDFSIQTTQTAYSLCDDTYEVVVTDNVGCTAKATVVITQPGPMTLDSSVVNTDCGEANGSACVLISGGTGPYTVIWPEGQVTQCVENLYANTYVVKVTDSKLCEERLPITVANSNAPLPEVRNITTPPCFGDCNGAATVGLVGDSTFYTVKWDAATGNQTGVTASGLCAGIYVVKFTTQHGCVASLAVTIDQPKEIEIFPSIQNPSCFKSCDGKVSAKVKGGTEPYTYRWIGDDGTEMGFSDSLVNLCAGFYTLLITDSNSCTQQTQIQIQDPAQIRADSRSENISCSSICDGKIEAIPLNGVAPYSYKWDQAANGQSSRVASGLCAGTYSCRITDRNNCWVEVTNKVDQPDTLILYLKNTINSTCNAACNGYAEVLAKGGTAPYNYTWTQGVGSGTFAKNLCAGNYVTKVTDAKGCESSVGMVIEEPAAIVINLTAGTASCNQACMGSVLADINGGTQPYKIQWDAPQSPTTYFVDSLCDGAYTVYVRDDNNCLASKAILVAQTTPVGINTTKVESTCGQKTGSICVAPFGGVAPYTFLWNDDQQQTTDCATQLASGCYMVMVTDANGCENVYQVCLDDISGPNVDPIFSKNLSCFKSENGYVEFKYYGGTGNLTTELLDAQNKVIATNVFAQNNLAAGCYTLLVTDALGCKSAENMCITEPQQLSAFVPFYSPAKCFQACDGEATVNISGGTLPYQVNWNGGNAATQLTNTGLCAGLATVLVTDSNGCQAMGSATITEPLKLLIDSLQRQAPRCFGDCNGRIDAAVSGGSVPYSYQWNTTSVNSAYITSLCTGNYSVVVTDRFGCQNSLSTGLQQPSALIMTTDSVNATCGECNGVASVTVFGGSKPYFYNWQGAGDNANSDKTSGLCEGNYIIKVDDKNGCLISNNVNIKNSVKPRIDSIVTVKPSCSDYANGTLTVFASGGTGQLNYAWDALAYRQTTQTAVALKTGFYCVTVKDQLNCEVVKCKDIDEPKPIQLVTSASQNVCNDETVQFYGGAYGGSSNYVYHWNDTTLVGPGPHTRTLTQNASYCFYVTDTKGCKSADTCVDFYIIPDPVVKLNSTGPICKGDSISLLAHVSGGKPSTYNWNWSNPAGNKVQATNNYDLSLVSVLSDSTGYYRVQVLDGCNREDEDSILVVINPVPDLDLGDVIRKGCSPFVGQIILPASTSNFYEIDYECDGIYDYYGPESNIQHTYKDSGVYSICIRATSDKGCVSTASYANQFVVYPSPTVDFTLTPEELDPSDPTVRAISHTVNATNLSWNFGDLFMASGKITDVTPIKAPGFGTLQNIGYTFVDDGEYNITLRGANDHGCVAELTKTVLVTSEFQIHVPNAFSPNGDIFNEYFTPKGMGFRPEDFTISIFDRWGEEIFHSHNLHDYWDGKISGKPVKNDVYVWVIKVIDFSGHEHNLTGRVTIVK